MIRDSKTVVGVTLLLLAYAAQLGCATVPRRQYFTLSYPMPTGLSKPLHPFSVRVRPFRISVPYDRPQIVYRESPYLFRYYVYRLWASKPQHVLREIVARHLQASGLVREVELEYGEKIPDFELMGEVLAIEEFDSGDVWYGHLAMRFWLVRSSDRAVVWRYFFDRRRRAAKRRPVYVVRAISRILEEEMQKVLAELDMYFSKVRGVEPTLGQALEHQRPRPVLKKRVEKGSGEGERRPQELRLELEEEEELIVPEEGPQDETQ